MVLAIDNRYLPSRTATDDMYYVFRCICWMQYGDGIISGCAYQSGKGNDIHINIVIN